MRNRIGPATGDGAHRTSRHGRPAPDDPESAGEIAELRRRLRRHPCHDCDDREDHARWAERYHRLARETEALERRVAGRTHIIARTFDRVCRVLERLGYLDGDTVTPDGQRLARLYTELDLLAAECLRHGLWDEPGPGRARRLRLGAVLRVAAADDVQPPRLPERRASAGARRDDPRSGASWTSWRRTTICRSCASPTSASPGPPTAGPAARGWRACWTSRRHHPGDFVRWTKQLIDLLDQIAAAAHDRDGLAATARAAVDAMRRGVIAYSAVTD